MRCAERRSLRLRWRRRRRLWERIRRLTRWARVLPPIAASAALLALSLLLLLLLLVCQTQLAAAWADSAQ